MDDDMNRQKELPNDEKVIFIPEEEIKAIKNIYDKMEQVQQELHKIIEESKYIQYSYILTNQNI
ncbi:MAG: hypothetical protein LBL90_09590 [Prevotellaceae bacterium]|jgi:hypothetical protein|nr:hypothetical protein [Prevotellaceae bacterium]